MKFLAPPLRGVFFADRDIRPALRPIKMEGVPMVKGVVKWFNNQKGYGFLVPDGGKDVFVHYSVVQGDGYKTLTAGQQVEFEVITSDKGDQARNVVKSG
jgi:CspA family cold shock protein